MRSTVPRQALEWLAAAATDPRACKREWEHGESGTVLLPAGRFWDVLSVPEELGLLAVDALLRVSRQEPGPTLADFGAHRVGFFLPPDPTTHWVGSGTRYAGKGTWIAVPAPHRAAGRLRWLVPPDGTGTLYSPAAVELALRQAVGLLTTVVRPRRPHPWDGPASTGHAARGATPRGERR
ncbi:hypothetical protein QMK19_33420 [Streptomyces sp. H10-C2]|uniref:hypothetical protein n=1 Tax=unclassified Streptomyces TaxID=2593676 RepID=UPI0024B99A37|nr:MULTISPECIES: hypothetical protein [unclassified Streptomyces]MDJ0346459.1 hypothetical protein [Streptomyces sp. PH10-H1]MDJ0374398.1 hypothetical protein [Streptomyces sp. H10-C2]